MEDIKEFLVRELDNNFMTISYLDFNVSETIIQGVNKSITLNELEDGVILKEVVAEFIIENFKFETDLKEGESIFDIYIDKDENIDFSKLLTKIKLASHMISYYGRIGLCNTLIINENTFNKYLICDDELNEYEIVFNNFLPENEIFLNRKCDINQPGFQLIYFENSYLITGIGFYPERQTARIKINDLN